MRPLALRPQQIYLQISCNIDYRLLLITDQFECITIRFNVIDLVYTKNFRKKPKIDQLSIICDQLCNIDYRLLLITDQLECITIRFNVIDLVYTKIFRKKPKIDQLSIICDQLLI